MVNYNAFWLILVNCSSELGSSYPPPQQAGSCVCPEWPDSRLAALAVSAEQNYCEIHTHFHTGDKKSDQVTEGLLQA